VPLTLVTGPANSAKAGAVLGPLRERLAEEPILVVPAFEEVEHSQRELAERGAIFGARVVRFSALFRTVASRAGLAARRASELQRQLVMQDAVLRSRLDVLHRSAEQPGFARAAVRFAAELERSMVEPARLTSALRQWAGDGPRRRYGEEVAEVYRRYRAGLEAAGLVDEDLFAWRALEALRAAPASWGQTPVFAYGFDDFDPLELQMLEELADHVGVDVTVSLPFEAGKQAFRATAATREHLAERASSTVILEHTAEHYADDSREALHSLERRLFEPGKAVVRSGGAVRLHVAGGERAELELCGAEVLGLLQQGTPPGEVAVVLRDPERYGSLIEQVFDAYGIPFSIDRSVPLAHTGVGRGLLALLRCARLEGTADDLLTYLRAPGLLREPALADRLEAEVRREGARTAAEARVLWERRHWPLDAIDRLERALDAATLIGELHRCLSRLFAAPYRRRAPVLSGAELDDPRAFEAAHDALTELHAVARADGGLRVDDRSLHETLERLRVRVGESPQPDRVQVASPLQIRARRFAAVFVCGLVEGEFPARAAPEAFLPDSDRRELARASGLRLPLREDQLERERYLFYVCASRAERLLVLSTRVCDEEGNPVARSFLLSDVEAVLADLDEYRRTRTLAEVTWSLGEAPTEAEWERAMARAAPRRSDGGARPLTDQSALEELRAKEALSAGALERFASCPMKWLVEDVLDPEKLEPDPEQMVRGSYAHRVLEVTFRGLRERTGSRRITPGNLPEAERILVSALQSERGEFRLSPDQTRVRAAVRRLEFDLLRYLSHEAGRDGLFEPEHLELRFGFRDSEHPAVELQDGTRVRGVIDRVDTWNGWALVRDYKSGKTEKYKATDWEKENRFQAALYMLAVERALGLRAAGGVYVPLSGTDRRPRGLVLEELADELGSDFVPTDRADPERFEEMVGWARTAIHDTVETMRAGQLCSLPDSCAWRGGCSYPSICRVQE